jgi:hypothetical protein
MKKIENIKKYGVFSIKIDNAKGKKYRLKLLKNDLTVTKAFESHVDEYLIDGV